MKFLFQKSVVRALAYALLESCKSFALVVCLSKFLSVTISHAHFAIKPDIQAKNMPQLTIVFTENLWNKINLVILLLELISHTW